MVGEIFRENNPAFLLIWLYWTTKYLVINEDAVLALILGLSVCFSAFLNEGDVFVNNNIQL